MVDRPAALSGERGMGVEDTSEVAAVHDCRGPDIL